jgi:MFS family permease
MSTLRVRDFRLLLYVRVLSFMALQAQDVIIGWQVYSLTHDFFMLGLVGLTEAVPALIGALFAGHVVDIGKPFRIYIGCIFMLAINGVALYIIAGGIMPVSEGIILPCLFVGIFISGLARSFITPSSYSLIPQVVTRNEIPAASALIGSGFQFGAIVGPAVAGLVYGIYGVTAAWFIPTTLMIAAFFMLIPLSAHARAYQSQATREPTFKSIYKGWRFVRERPALLSVMALDMFAVLFGGAVAMLPAYADQVLHIGSEGLGVLRAAPALGAIVSALFLAVFPMQRIYGRTLLFVVAGFGCCIIVFGLSTSFALSMCALALSGVFDSVSVVIRTTLVQLLTTDEMRGRVSALNSMFIISSNEIGAFESGTAAKLMGLVPSVVFGGVMSLVVVAATALLCPQLRKMSVGAGDTTST